MNDERHYQKPPNYSPKAIGNRARFSVGEDSRWDDEPPAENVPYNPDNRPWLAEQVKTFLADTVAEAVENADAVQRTDKAKASQEIAAKLGQILGHRDERVACLRWLFDDLNIGSTNDLTKPETYAMQQWLGSGFKMPATVLATEIERVNAAWKRGGQTASFFDEPDNDELNDEF